MGAKCNELDIIKCIEFRCMMLPEGVELSFLFFSFFLCVCCGGWGGGRIRRFRVFLQICFGHCFFGILLGFFSNDL